MVLSCNEYEYIRKLKDAIVTVIWPWTGRPDVARVNLFMSFPNSGSRYGITVLEVATGHTAASFYGKEFVDVDGRALHRDESVLAYEELPTGPFLTNNLALQTGGKLLTRTYCGGHCLSHCTCEEYDITLDEFEKECTLSEDADATRDYLDASIMSSTIIMMRNPLDNVVSRFHYEHRLNSGQGYNPYFKEWTKSYPNDYSGFSEWCEFIDETNEFTEQICFSDDPTLLELMNDVPCHSEFYKFTHWYNNAFELIAKIGSESRSAYYEDFFLRPEKQIRQIVDFLELNNTGEMFDFSLRDYTYYYTLEKRTKVIHLINHIASNDTKFYLRRYLVLPSP